MVVEKDVIVDFLRRKVLPSLVNIQGMETEMVDSNKYLGIHLNKNLDWTDYTQALYKKGQSRLHLLRRLRSFGVSQRFLRTFYDSVIASAIFYAAVGWSSSITVAERKRRLDKLVKRASSVLGCSLDPILLSPNWVTGGWWQSCHQSWTMPPIHYVRL